MDFFHKAGKRRSEALPLAEIDLQGTRQTDRRLISDLA
jgi:hypothetical protein